MFSKIFDSRTVDHGLQILLQNVNILSYQQSPVNLFIILAFGIEGFLKAERSAYNKSMIFHPENRVRRTTRQKFKVRPI